MKIVSNFTSCSLNPQKRKKMELNLWGSNIRATNKTMSNICSLTKRNPTLVSIPCLTKAKCHIRISGVLVDQHTLLEEVYIFFDTATYDEIERDVKVSTTSLLKPLPVLQFFAFKSPPQGDNGGPAWTDRRHNGAPHWLLHSQRGRDLLLPA